MQKKALVTRQTYLDRILMFRDTDLIKVVTGVRRCGKSSLLELARDAIMSERVSGRSFAFLNLESKKCPITNESDLYAFFKSKMSAEGRTYLFLDEPPTYQGGGSQRSTPSGSISTVTSTSQAPTHTCFQASYRPICPSLRRDQDAASHHERVSGLLPDIFSGMRRQQ